MSKHLQILKVFCHVKIAKQALQYYLIVLLEGVFNLGDACFRADECEGVEQLTQRVVATIEQILGEPIQQYF